MLAVGSLIVTRFNGRSGRIVALHPGERPIEISGQFVPEVVLSQTDRLQRFAVGDSLQFAPNSHYRADPSVAQPNDVSSKQGQQAECHKIQHGVSGKDRPNMLHERLIHSAEDDFQRYQYDERCARADCPVAYNLTQQGSLDLAVNESAFLLDVTSLASNYLGPFMVPAPRVPFAFRLDALSRQWEQLVVRGERSPIYNLSRAFLTGGHPKQLPGYTRRNRPLTYRFDRLKDVLAMLGVMPVKRIRPPPEVT